MECQFGLIDKLISLDVLNDRIARQLSESKPFEQNEILLDYFCDKQIKPEPFYKLDKFVEALEMTQQRHLAALLLGYGLCLTIS
jgi:hypothetical protein